MPWKVELHDDFESEFKMLPELVQDELLAKALVLEHFGPNVGRPHADTLKGSAYANMKELRFDVLGAPWRVAFAFDPKRKAILLTAGNKRGRNSKRFYQSLIRKADSRFEQYLESLKNTT